MIGRRKLFITLVGIAVALALAPTCAPGQDKAAPAAVKIGMAGTLFRDVPAGMVQVMMPPFRSLMREQTGLEGEIITAGDAFDLGRRLNDKDVQLGVFHGFEFAWAQQKYPDLRPLCLAVNRHRTVRAFLVVRSDSPAASLGDLKGKALSLPRRTREYCHLFLERDCQSCGALPKDFFSKIVNHSNIEDALDDILRDKVQAAVVDTVALETYEQIKSGCFARLKVLKQSEAFPGGVVAYRQGTLDETTLSKFRDGLININQTSRGRDLMALWRLTAFEGMPADFEETLATCLKAFPAPDGAASEDKTTK
jgi:ABC-type phosphate/phosphonate transport system substrate-binding protein